MRALCEVSNVYSSSRGASTIGMLSIVRMPKRSRCAGTPPESETRYEANDLSRSVSDAPAGRICRGRNRSTLSTPPNLPPERAGSTSAQSIPSALCALAGHHRAIDGSGSRNREKRLGLASRVQSICPFPFEAFSLSLLLGGARENCSMNEVVLAKGTLVYVTSAGPFSRRKGMILSPKKTWSGCICFQ